MPTESSHCSRDWGDTNKHILSCPYHFGSHGPVRNDKLSIDDTFLINELQSSKDKSTKKEHLCQIEEINGGFQELL